MVCTSYAELGAAPGRGGSEATSTRNDASSLVVPIVVTDSGQELPPIPTWAPSRLRGRNDHHVLTSWGMFASPTMRLLLHPELRDDRTPMETLFLAKLRLTTRTSWEFCAEAVARRLTRFLTAGGRDAATPPVSPIRSVPKTSWNCQHGDIRFDADHRAEAQGWS